MEDYVSEFIKKFAITEIKDDIVYANRDILHFDSSQKLPKVGNEIELVVSPIHNFGEPSPYKELSVKAYYEW